MTDEELIDGLSFPAYRRVATMIFVPAQSHRASSIEMVTIEPQDLQAAQDRDACAITVDLDQEVSAQPMAMQKIRLSAKLAVG